MPKVSVIIPCYNQGHFLQEAVASVLAQTYQDYEIIIINDGSDNADTNQVIKNFNHKKIVVLEIENVGLPEARNKGITNSNGEFIMLLDADNKITPQYLDKTIAVFEQNQSVDIVYTNGIYFGEKSEMWEQPKLELPLMLTRNLIDACAIYKKTVWDKCSGYNKNMKFGWEDWDFWLTAIEHDFKFYHLAEPLFNYRVGKESMRDQIEIYKQRRQYLENQLIRNHTELYKQYFPEPLTMLRELYALRNERQSYDKYKNEIHNSRSYQLGNFILKPLKFLSKIISKKAANE